MQDPVCRSGIVSERVSGEIRDRLSERLAQLTPEQRAAVRTVMRERIADELRERLADRLPTDSPSLRLSRETPCGPPLGRDSRPRFARGCLTGSPTSFRMVVGISPGHAHSKRPL